METVLPFFLLMLIGQLLRHIPVFPKKTDVSLNLYVIYIALPALTLQQVPNLDFSDNILSPLIMPWLVILFSSVVVLLLCKTMRWPKEITGSLLLMVPLGNTSFLGIPMVEQFFGSAAIPYAVLYDQFGSFLALSTYGTLILALYGSGSRPGIVSILKRVFLFPPFLALVAALFMHGKTYPDWMFTFLSMAAASMVPVVMVAIGFQMRLFLPKDELLPLAGGLGIRLLLTPIIFLYICKITGLSGPATLVSLFETAMPPMVTAGALASIAGLKPRLSSAMAAYGILAAFFTLPFIHSLF
ncbi:MAG TPA: AEC family transporter [Desulfocapsa sulfexigens]|nr:AEC family transporter [Desulfocapsa sulfexigens]